MAVVSSVQIKVDSSWVNSARITIPLRDSLFYQARAVMSDGTTSSDVVWSVYSGIEYIYITEYGSGMAAISTGATDGDAVVRCASASDPSKYAELYVTAGVGGGSSGLYPLFMIFVDPITEEQYAGKINLDVNETRTIAAMIVMSDYTLVDPVVPVEWSLYSGETQFSIISTTMNTATIKAGSTAGSSTYDLVAVYTYNGTSVSETLGVNVTGSAAPTVQQMETWYAGNWYAFSFDWKIKTGETLQLRGRALMSDGAYDYDIIWDFYDSTNSFIYRYDGYIGYFTAGDIAGEKIATVYIKSAKDTSKVNTVSITVEASEEPPPIEPAGTGYTAMIYNSTTKAFEKYRPYIYDNGWAEFAPHIYPFESDKPSFTVSSIGEYGFTKNSNGYWQSRNTGIHSSFALAKVEITLPESKTVYVDCIHQGESGYDYGLLSNIGSTLSESNSADTTGVMKNFRTSHSTNIQTVNYGTLAAGKHFFYAKYIKDGSVSGGLDSLQFTLRFE